ncbi:hypothetical protein [Nonomuraea sp. NPDC049028]|uniref:hypothetical protein n=1 Tax=Nonomuraea sp. NPDC049028 TaxID=3364348 RepID=UPI0037175FCE
MCEAKPGSRASALAPPARPARVRLPAPGEPVGFADHVKPLFREVDRKSMSFAFDLWSREDVAQHADAILHRLRQGTMPCDGAWSAEQVDLFARWITEGTAP